MPQRFDLMVFDWDGTLSDSAGAIVACIQNACRDCQLPVPDDEHASHVIGLGMQDALNYAVPGLQSVDYARIIDRYRHHYLLRDPDLPLFAGTEAMLRELNERAHYLAIATGKSHAGLTRALQSTGLAPHFLATRCADQCTPKPAPDMLLELIEELGVERERTLMIGDTTHDLSMAANAGVAAIGVSYGAHPLDQLQNYGALALLHSTRELHEWLLKNA
jgi:phosphoglycolate phosphatase